MRKGVEVVLLCRDRDSDGSTNLRKNVQFIFRKVKIDYNSSAWKPRAVRVLRS